MSQPRNAGLNLGVHPLLDAYRSRRLTPSAVIEYCLERIAEVDPDDNPIWLHVLSRAELQPYLDRLAGGDPQHMPLYGIPFAIKDNIDLAGVPTTAACPDFAYVPRTSAAVVQRLIEAGAIPLGKTNLDQFATGLVGTRSPYGAVRNAFDPAYLSGGSSAGSAVAVALGQVSFALGTDTAGSGRVPAAFNNLLGLKPSRGLLSTRGVVPACRTLDCVSIFALDAADAAQVFAQACQYDAEDPYARPAEPGPAARGEFRFGLPRQLEFHGDTEAERLFYGAVERCKRLGGEPVSLDFEPFLEAARLLYEGPWVAERYAAIADFIERSPDSLLPVTRGIIGGARGRTAVEQFQAQYRLQALRRHCDKLLADLEFVITPTTPSIYTIEAVQADPVALNSRLGHYTNFVNLLDLAAVAVPAGFGAQGLPYGVTLFAPAHCDGRLLIHAGRLQAETGLTAGATGHRLQPLPPDVTQAVQPTLDLVVCGAHLSGLPLNHQLLELGGRLLRSTTTSARYRLFALPGGPPHRPGLVRQTGAGSSIAVEVWRLPRGAIGSFLAGIPAPLGLGSVELADGSWEKGFICEGFAVEQAEDISHLGGWRAYLNSRS